MLNSLKKNYIYRLADQLFAILIPLILVPYTSRTLGAGSIGIYSYTLSIATVFSTLGRLGLNTYGQLQIAKNRNDPIKRNQIFWELMSLKLPLAAAEVLFYVLFVYWINEYLAVSLIMVVYLIADVFDITWFYLGIEDFLKIAWRSFIVKSLNLILVLLFVHTSGHLYRYTLIMQASVLLSNMGMWPGISKYVSKAQLLFGYNTILHLKRCFVYFIPTIANLIYNMLDKTMLGYIGKSALESGYYEQAYKIMRVANTIVLALGTVALPRLAYLHTAEENKTFSTIVCKTLRISYMLLFPMSAGLFFNAELIVRVVLGAEFLDSANVLRVLSILLVFGALNYNIGTQVLEATENQRKYNLGVAAGACLNFTLNLLFIRKYYAIGAAIGSLAAEMIIFVIFVVFAQKIVGLQTLFPRTGWKYLLATILMIACNLFLKTMMAAFASVIQLVLIVAVCAALYFSVLLCVHEDETWSILKSLGKKRRIGD